MPGTLFHCGNCDLCFPIEQRSSHESRQACTRKSTRDESCPFCLECLHNSQKTVSVNKCGHPAHFVCTDAAVSAGHFGCPLCRKSIVNMTHQWAQLRAIISCTPLPPDLFPIKESSNVGSPYGRFVVDEIRRIQPELTTTSSTGAAVTTSAAASATAAGAVHTDNMQVFRGRLVDWTLANGCHPHAYLTRDALTVDTRIFCHDCEARTTVPLNPFGLECQACGSFNTTR